MVAKHTEVDNTVASGVAGEDERGAARTETGLDENVAGALTYLLGVITGLVFYVVEPDNEFVRFHAAQSIATFGLVIGISIVFSAIGALASLLFATGSTGGFLVGTVVSLLLTVGWLVFWVASVGLWLYLMLRAYQGKAPRIPVAAGIADRLR